MSWTIKATLSTGETVEFTAETMEKKWQIERELNEAGVSHTATAK